MSIKNYLNSLKNQDIYSLLLFTLYRCNNLPECSTLSELAYVLDEGNLLNLCECFGGLTLRIPTLSELENLVYALNIYKETHINKIQLNDVIDSLELPKQDIENVKYIYSQLLSVMEDCKFGDD
mgnify:CR=1 FL=1